MPSTKLVCTLGPASADRVPELVAAGMSVARINLTHGERDQHEALLRAVRSAAEEAGRPVGVMTDLSGPKVRLGELDGEHERVDAAQVRPQAAAGLARPVAGVGEPGGRGDRPAPDLDAAHAVRDALEPVSEEAALRGAELVVDRAGEDLRRCHVVPSVAGSVSCHQEPPQAVQIRL
jgi:hypothetical protein